MPDKCELCPNGANNKVETFSEKCYTLKSIYIFRRILLKKRRVFGRTAMYIYNEMTRGIVWLH